MEMRHECNAEIGRFERFDTAIHHGSLGTPHHSGTKIDEIRCVIDHDRGCGPSLIGVRRRVSRSQQHNACLAQPSRGRLLVANQRDRKEHDPHRDNAESPGATIWATHQVLRCRVF
jgi:hypothetical protein